MFWNFSKRNLMMCVVYNAADIEGNMPRIADDLMMSNRQVLIGRDNHEP